jgi:hypothetical protein
MDTTLLDTRLNVANGGERVASYHDMHAAMLALSRLIEDDFPVDAVEIHPADLHARDEALACPPERPSRVAVIGAAVIGGLTTAAFVWNARGTVLSVLAGIAAAAISAAVSYAIAAIYIRLANRRVARAGRIIEAGRFDIVCLRRAPEANHLLAMWWHPRAPQVPPRGLCN